MVETVSVAVPEPFTTELGLNEQEGDGVAEGAIALQDRLTLPLKPFIEVMAIVEETIHLPKSLLARGAWLR